MKSFKYFTLEEDEINAYLKSLNDNVESNDSETCEDIYDEDFFELNEETIQPVEGKVSSDTKGKMHELLVGYHLKGGKHMSKHEDKIGDTPKQAHDKLKKVIHPNDYKKMNARAKSAANDIRKQVETNGHKIHDVHWTSKPGDIHRSTGIHATQKEDASDIVITTHKK
jgi:hypothetical protein